MWRSGLEALGIVLNTREHEALVEGKRFAVVPLAGGDGRGGGDRVHDVGLPRPTRSVSRLAHVEVPRVRNRRVIVSVVKRHCYLGAGGDSCLFRVGEEFAYDRIGHTFKVHLRLHGFVFGTRQRAARHYRAGKSGGGRLCQPRVAVRRALVDARVFDLFTDTCQQFR